MSMNWTHCKGKRILHVDYTGMDEASMLKQMESYYRVIGNESEVRQISNFGDELISKTFLDKAKQMEIENSSDKTIKMALIGVNRFLKSYVFGFNLFTKANAQAFESEEEAMEWLAHD